MTESIPPFFGRCFDVGRNIEGKEARMSGTRVWVGVMFLALGVLGILAIAGTLDWDRTVGEWWPVAIIGWPVSEMIAKRHVSVDGIVIAGIGLAFLADEQEWAAGSVIWTTLFLLIGVAILAAPFRKHDLKGQDAIVQGTGSES